jgi:hypothetical protein
MTEKLSPSFAELLAFMRSHSLGIQASVSSAHAPQAAVVGYVVTDDFCLFFDTVETNRKVSNLRQNPRIAFVIGGWVAGDERTVQYEGVADEPAGPDLKQLQELYFERFPEGRARRSWPGLMYIRCRPVWIRFTDFNQAPPKICEFDAFRLRSQL